jgi:hypothetical protein
MVRLLSIPISDSGGTLPYAGRVTELQTLPSPAAMRSGEAPVRHRREFGVKLPDGTVRLCDSEDDARIRREDGTVVCRDVISVTWS